MKTLEERRAKRAAAHEARCRKFWAGQVEEGRKMTEAGEKMIALGKVIEAQASAQLAPRDVARGNPAAGVVT